MGTVLVEAQQVNFALVGQFMAVNATMYC